MRPSEAGDFRLAVFTPEAPARGPGAPLAGKGASGEVDSLQHIRDAYSYRMLAGRSYRLNLSSKACVDLLVYPPGTRNFDRSEPQDESGCNGYLLFTPRASGRYSLVAQAASSVHTTQRYHLQAALAGADDIAPGTVLPNLTAVRSSLQGNGVDTVDLYRFGVGQRSALELTLDYGGTGSARLQLLDDQRSRRSPAGESEISRRVNRGLYYVAVRTPDGGAGRYTLRRVSRLITSTRTTIDGSGGASVAPGRSVAIAAHVTPATAGPVVFTVERFDPLAGWQFVRELRAQAAAGAATCASPCPPKATGARGRRSWGRRSRRRANRVRDRDRRDAAAPFSG